VVQSMDGKYEAPQPLRYITNIWDATLWNF